MLKDLALRIKQVNFGEITHTHLHTYILFLFLFSSINLSHSILSPTPPYKQTSSLEKGYLHKEETFSWPLLNIYTDLCVSLIKPPGEI